MKVIVIILVILNSAFLALAQNKSDTYLETRELLTKMEPPHADKHLAKLFKEADVRMSDLVRALDDKDEKVRLNSQYIIAYLAGSEGLQRVNEWQKRQTGTFVVPNVQPLAAKVYLEGDSSNLVRLVQRNIDLFRVGRHHKNPSIELVAFNKRNKTALFEIFTGNIFTEGWHAVIRFEDNKWRLISDTLRWQS